MEKSEVIEYLIKNSSILQENKRDELLEHFKDINSRYKELEEYKNRVQNLKDFILAEIAIKLDRLLNTDNDLKKDLLSVEIEVYREIQERINDII